MLACNVGDDRDPADELGDTTASTDGQGDADAGIAGEDPTGLAATVPPRRATAIAHRGGLATDDAGACRMYCDAYAGECGDGGAYADTTVCMAACASWPAVGASKLADTVTCRASFLAAGRTSCIAAGPSSPVCSDDV